VKRLLVTGGGTAGHVVPAIPVMERLLESGVVVDFVGSGSDFERELLSGLPVRYHGISTGKLRRYFSLENVLDAFRVIRGTWQAYWLVRRLRPDVVFSKGGFVSAPVVFAAWLQRRPVVAHESDLTPGLANRLALPFVRTLCVNFPVTRPSRFKGEVIYSGTPVRSALLNGDRAKGRALLGIPEGSAVVLVTGGSLGADRLNEVVRGALGGLLELASVVHVCGAGKTKDIDRPGYYQFEYVEDEWGDLLAAADVVVSRAGANTLYELLCLRKRNLLIPLPKKASRGDQLENAAYAQAEGFSHVIDESDLTATALVTAVNEILNVPGHESGKIAAFAPPDSVSLIVGALEQAATEETGGD
jgi:UDP-N-acetylglucosamine--N-acetylmuramyl-(pentapeptide) pyrophosphoryl-undecaprenol N-acetylglucosamine transferase